MGRVVVLWRCPNKQLSTVLLNLLHVAKPRTEKYSSVADLRKGWLLKLPLANGCEVGWRITYNTIFIAETRRSYLCAFTHFMFLRVATFLPFVCQLFLCSTVFFRVHPAPRIATVGKEKCISTEITAYNNQIFAKPVSIPGCVTRPCIFGQWLCSSILRRLTKLVHTADAVAQYAMWIGGRFVASNCNRANNSCDSAHRHIAKHFGSDGVPHERVM